MQTFRALRVFEEAGVFAPRKVVREADDLPAGEVLVRVLYSSLNYKDALSLTGNKGVTRKYPHTPGIDAAGTVLVSTSAQFKSGDQVIVTGYDLGMNTDGGFAECIRVPASWVVPMPKTLDARRAMMYGTAGLTAALCADTLMQVGIMPMQGDVLVTGATGGVGSLAVMLMAQQGYSVVAGTGKAERAAWLLDIGASGVISREDLLAGSEKTMLKERWAGAIDTVGGDILFNVVKSTRYGGSVACCGLTAGTNFQANVFPFILRGVNLLGIDSVELPLELKQDMWNLLAGEWAIQGIENIVEEIALDAVPEYAGRILRGEVSGRVIVSLA